MSDAVLRAEDVTMRFGGLTALSKFNLELRPKELVGLIGPNGAGKTTAFNALSGVYAPTEGSVFLGGVRVNGLRPHQVCAQGIARTFQNIRLFKNLSALDNVRIARHARGHGPLWEPLLGTRSHDDREANMEARARELLAVMGLGDRADEQAKNLPYGLQRRLEIARALGADPKVLCLDEPAAGMNATETAALMSLIHDIRDRFGVAVLLIEHDMKLVMGISERLIVLDHGVTIASGKPEDVRKNPKVIEAYLGVEEGHKALDTEAA
ncbi:MAG: branched-chain amino acid transport system ATP-binding protein [Elusimicrobia bacterium]|nr:MAG: branched-chain amino acid transport system ATP-binding protein [Elusimicrobiota bacterium]